MSSKQYAKKFKIEAAKQINKRGYCVAEVAERLGITSHSLYSWVKRYAKPNPQAADRVGDHIEIARLKAKLHRVTKKRDTKNPA